MVVEVGFELNEFSLVTTTSRPSDRLSIAWPYAVVYFKEKANVSRFLQGVFDMADVYSRAYPLKDWKTWGLESYDHVRSYLVLLCITLSMLLMMTIFISSSSLRASFAKSPLTPTILLASHALAIVRINANSFTPRVWNERRIRSATVDPSFLND